MVTDWMSSLTVHDTFCGEAGGGGVRFYEENKFHKRFAEKFYGFIFNT